MIFKTVIIFFLLIIQKNISIKCQKNYGKSYLLCPQPKGIQLSVREEQRKQKVFTF